MEHTERDYQDLRRANARLRADVERLTREIERVAQARDAAQSLADHHRERAEHEAAEREAAVQRRQEMAEDLGRVQERERELREELLLSAGGNIGLVTGEPCWCHGDGGSVHSAKCKRRRALLKDGD